MHQYDNTGYQAAGDSGAPSYPYQHPKYKYAENLDSEHNNANHYRSGSNVSGAAGDDSVFYGDENRENAMYGSGYQQGRASSGYGGSHPSDPIQPMLRKDTEGQSRLASGDHFQNFGSGGDVDDPRSYTGSGPLYEMQRISRSFSGMEQNRSNFADRDGSTLSSREQNPSTLSTVDDSNINARSYTRDDQSYADRYPEYSGCRPPQYTNNPARTSTLAALIRESIDPSNRNQLSAGQASDSYSIRSPRGGEISQGSVTNEEHRRRLRNRSQDLLRLDPNRSIMSGEYRVNKSSAGGTRYPSGGEGVTATTDQHDHSGSSAKDSGVENGESLKRDALTHRKVTSVIQPNGVARPVRDNGVSSHRSISLSHFSLNRHPSKLILYGKGYGVHNSLVSLILISVLSFTIAFLGLEMLFRVNERTASERPTDDSLLSLSAFKHVREVCVTFCVLVLLLDMGCLMVCTLQCYLAAKLLKCPQGEER